MSKCLQDFADILPKKIYALIILMLFNSAFAQTNKQLHRIKPNWKLGDQKTVYSTSSTKVFIKDSLVNSTQLTNKYTMKVIDTVKNFIVAYTSEPNSTDLQAKSSNVTVDSALNIFTTIFEKIEQQTQSFQFELSVSKKTGEALKVNNEAKYLKLLQDITMSMIDEFGNKYNRPTRQLDSIKTLSLAQLRMSAPKILQTAINQFNYIMQPYSFEFPYNSSISHKAMIHDVNAMGSFGDIEMPAIVTVSSTLRDKNLTVFSDTDYDKDFLLQQIKKKYRNMNDLTVSDIFLSEKVETVFMTTSSWLISHKSKVIFKTKEVKVLNETSIRFE